MILLLFTKNSSTYFYLWTNVFLYLIFIKRNDFYNPIWFYFQENNFYSSYLKNYFYNSIWKKFDFIGKKKVLGFNFIKKNDFYIFIKYWNQLLLKEMVPV